MSDEEQAIIQRVVDQFARTGTAADAHVNVTTLPMNKTSTIEQTGADGRTVLLKEYTSEGKKIWAAYSSRSQTVYVSASSASPMTAAPITTPLV